MPFRRSNLYFVNEGAFKNCRAKGATPQGQACNHKERGTPLDKAHTLQTCGRPGGGIRVKTAHAAVQVRIPVHNLRFSVGQPVLPERKCIIPRMGASLGFRVRAEVEFLQELQTGPRQVHDDEAVRAEVATWPNADGLPKCMGNEGVPLFRDEREGAQAVLVSQLPNPGGH